MLTHWDGPFAASGIGRGNGYYSLRWNDDGSANLMYTDITSRQTVYLSSEIASEHNGETDPSWISDGASYLFADDDAIYFAQNFAQTGMQATDKLWRLDSNGENRRLLTEFEPNQRLSQTVASDGEFLYTVVETVSSNAQSAPSLYRISIVDGAKEKIAELSNGEFLVGACDDRLIFKTTPLLDDAQNDNDKGLLFALSVKDGTKERLVEWLGETHYGIVSGKSYYYMECDFQTQTARLSVLDLTTGSTATIHEAVPIGATWDAVSVQGIYDGRLLYYVTQPNPEDAFGVIYRGYSVSLSHGMISDIVLMCEVQGQTYVKILWEFEDCFLVRNGEKLETKVIQGPEGTSYTTQISVPQWAVMEKQDFWNNQPNYSMIS